jgi:hypothetical protein
VRELSHGENVCAPPPKNAYHRIRAGTEGSQLQRLALYKGAHEQALVTVATMVGTLVLARAVDDPKLSEKLLEAALKKLAPTDA